MVSSVSFIMVSDNSSSSINKMFSSDSSPGALFQSSVIMNSSVVSLKMSFVVSLSSIVLGSVSLKMSSVSDNSSSVSLVVVLSSVVFFSVGLIMVLDGNIPSLMSCIEVCLHSSCMSSVVDFSLGSSSQVSLQMGSILSVRSLNSVNVSLIASFRHARSH